MVILDAWPFWMLEVVIPAAMRGADSAEGRAPRVAGLMELAHHILIKLFSNEVRLSE